MLHCTLHPMADQCKHSIHHHFHTKRLLMRLKNNVTRLARRLDLLYDEVPLNNIAIQGASQLLALATTALAHLQLQQDHYHYHCHCHYHYHYHYYLSTLFESNLCNHEPCMRAAYESKLSNIQSSCTTKQRLSI